MWNHYNNLHEHFDYYSHNLDIDEHNLHVDDAYVPTEWRILHLSSRQYFLHQH